MQYGEKKYFKIQPGIGRLMLRCISSCSSLLQKQKLTCKSCLCLILANWCIVLTFQPALENSVWELGQEIKASGNHHTVMTLRCCPQQHLVHRDGAATARHNFEISSYQLWTEQLYS